MKRVFTAVADEAGFARRRDQVFSPVLDIARDPRWGRTEETYGEDPYLVSRMGVAAIEGLQGDSFIIDRHHVMATAKHFAVHGQPEGGTNTAPGNYSERIIRENFLVPFQAAVKEAHVGSVMASYNEIDGVPSHDQSLAARQECCAQEWGFDGYVTSDDNGLQMLVDHSSRGARTTPKPRARRSPPGVDFDLSGRPGLPHAGRSGEAGHCARRANWIVPSAACWPPSSGWGFSIIPTSIPTTPSASTTARSTGNWRLKPREKRSCC